MSNTQNEKRQLFRQLLKVEDVLGEKNSFSKCAWVVSTCITTMEKVFFLENNKIKDKVFI